MLCWSSWPHPCQFHPIWAKTILMVVHRTQAVSTKSFDVGKIISLLHQRRWGMGPNFTPCRWCWSLTHTMLSWTWRTATISTTPPPPPCCVCVQAGWKSHCLNYISSGLVLAKVLAEVLLPAQRMGNNDSTARERKNVCFPIRVRIIYRKLWKYFKNVVACDWVGKFLITGLYPRLMVRVKSRF